MAEDRSIEYSPLPGFAMPGDHVGGAPVVFGSPLRYVQGDGVIDHTGHYISSLGYRRVAVLMSRRSQDAEGKRLLDSLARDGAEAETITFNGECSLEEIGAHVSHLAAQERALDLLVAVGGGKAVDAGKAIAHRLQLPCAVVPSLASNDAPCAGVSVIYTAEGATLDAEIYNRNPVLVLVDTGVVAEAGPRYLAAGMGDAMATWYEARVCAGNPGAITVFGGRPTLAGSAIARLCMETLFEVGRAALDACRESRVTPALEKIVEANTLLSGLGYESGGLAAAHAFAQGFTLVPRVHKNYLHGEHVAIGTLGQLLLEGDREEAERVARLFLELGLPVHLGQLGLGVNDREDLQAVVQGALAFPFIGNMTVPCGEHALLQSLLDVDRLGRSLLDKN
jgi:glycerol dehydrogenase